MTNWIETYRGTVPPWQCDVTEHFTVAYYFDRVEEAEAKLAEALGIGGFITPSGNVSRRLDVRYARELRAGAGFHVESAALGIDILRPVCVWAIASSIPSTARWSPGSTSIGTCPPTP